VSGDSDWIDVSRRLPSGHPVWPGDAPFRLEPTSRLSEGATVNLSRLSGTTHLGSHLDAPLHYDDAGAAIESVPLMALIGPGVVIDVRNGRGPIQAADLPAGALPGRVLLRTGQPNAWDVFPTEIRPLTTGAIARLADAGVALVGTDAPSVDELDSTDLPAHHACGRAGLAIVEGLALEAAPSGPCDVMILPLPLIGVDAAPVRAVLRPARP
jgi:arylformamidase